MRNKTTIDEDKYKTINLNYDYFRGVFEIKI